MTLRFEENVWENINGVDWTMFAVVNFFRPRFVLRYIKPQFIEFSHGTADS